MPTECPIKNAIKSHNSSEFIDTGRHLVDTLRRFEDLYLYYNIPKDQMSNLMNKLGEFNSAIKTTKENSKRVYFKKEPDFI